jgi:predicted phosphodiesterase
MAGRSLSDEQIADIRRRYAAGESRFSIANDTGLDRNTVAKYTAGVAIEGTAAKPTPATLPASIPQPFIPYSINHPGKWLILSDVHIPYHDEATVQAAIETAVKEKAVGVVLNGDILDCHELSDFDKEPGAPRYVEERDKAIQFFTWLRKRLPKALIVYKEGNHEERLGRYVIKRAPALFGLQCVTLPSLLELDGFGVEWVAGKRVIKIGHLSAIHGHELKGGITAPVNPARGFFLKCKESVIGGHHHQTSEHHEPTLNGKQQAAWSTGCACGLNPPYMPINKWNLGFAMVDLFESGEFSVRNFRFMNGRVV